MTWWNMLKESRRIIQRNQAMMHHGSHILQKSTRYWNRFIIAGGIKFKLTLNETDTKKGVNNNEKTKSSMHKKWIMNTLIWIVEDEH